MRGNAVHASSTSVTLCAVVSLGPLRTGITFSSRVTLRPLCAGVALCALGRNPGILVAQIPVAIVSDMRGNAVRARRASVTLGAVVALRPLRPRVALCAVAALGSLRSRVALCALGCNPGVLVAQIPVAIVADMRGNAVRAGGQRQLAVLVCPGVAVPQLPHAISGDWRMGRDIPQPGLRLAKLRWQHRPLAAGGNAGQHPQLRDVGMPLGVVVRLQRAPQLHGVAPFLRYHAPGHHHGQPVVHRRHGPYVRSAGRGHDQQVPAVPLRDVAGHGDLPGLVVQLSRSRSLDTAQLPASEIQHGHFAHLPFSSIVTDAGPGFLPGPAFFSASPSVWDSHSHSPGGVLPTVVPSKTL